MLKGWERHEQRNKAVDILPLLSSMESTTKLLICSSAHTSTNPGTDRVTITSYNTRGWTRDGNLVGGSPPTGVGPRGPDSPSAARLGSSVSDSTVGLPSHSVPRWLTDTLKLFLCTLYPVKWVLVASETKGNPVHPPFLINKTDGVSRNTPISFYHPQVQETPDFSLID